MAVQLALSSPPASTPWRRRPPRVRSPRRGRPPRRTAACALAAALVSLAVGGAGPAWGNDAVNVTFHVPAQGQTNPRFPAEVVNLNGDIHVVIATTTDRSVATTGLRDQQPAHRPEHLRPAPRTSTGLQRRIVPDPPLHRLFLDLRQRGDPVRPVAKPGTSVVRRPTRPTRCPAHRPRERAPDNAVRPA
jgi:hypothetical protein